MLLDQDRAALDQLVTAFVRDEINPRLADWEAARSIPLHELFRKMGAVGLLGVARPSAFGGAGLDFSFTVTMAEALGEANGGAVQMAIGVHAEFASGALARFGSDDLRRAYLAPVIAGDMVASLGVTERRAGSDVVAIDTSARRDGGDWIINGEKTWVTNGAQADFMVVLANTSDAPRHRNKSLFVVPLNGNGVERGGAVEKLGMHAADTPTIRLNDVRVPACHLIGEAGRGFQYQMAQFDEERIWAAANALRTLQRCVEATVEYTLARPAFGGALFDKQAIRFRLAELKTEIEALRALTYSATERLVSGEAVGEQAAMAKLIAGRLLRKVPDACLQYWGAEGYGWHNPISRLFRDGRLASIGGGADEVMLSIIARRMAPREA